MNILVEGFFDRNFGDDIMIRLIAHQLFDCRLYIKENKRELLLPFADDSNIYNWFDYKSEEMDFTLKIIGSGFIISGKTGIFYSMLDIFGAIKTRLGKTKKPAAVIGCSIGPLYSSFAKRLVLLQMSRYNLFTARDTFSYSFISTYLKRKQVYCYPDIVFSMPDGWLPENTKEGCLGISAYRMRHSSNLEHYKKLAKVANEYIKKNNKKVILFAFDIENENDLAAAYTIKEFCENKSMVEIVPHNDNGNNIICNMSRCSHIISVRLHSCIMAIRMGIPFTPIIYSSKTDYVLDDLGYGGVRFYLEDFSAYDVLKHLSEGKPFKADASVFENAKNHSKIVRKMLGKDNGEKNDAVGFCYNTNV